MFAIRARGNSDLVVLYLTLYLTCSLIAARNELRVFSDTGVDPAIAGAPVFVVPEIGEEVVGTAVIAIDRDSCAV